MGEDQAHEQHNKVIKEDGGAVGLFDNEHAVVQWAISGPTISQILHNPGPDKTTRHHEDTVSFERKFKNDCTALQEAFETWGNQF